MNINPEKINLVWLKRDIRSQDHDPLAAANASGIPYLICYFFEPSLLQSPDSSFRHQRFVYQSIQDLNQQLVKSNNVVNVFYGEAVEVFENLFKQFTILSIFSYQESGTQKTWNRDKEISRLLKLKGVKWQQFQKNGVQRGINNRRTWDKNWYAKMNTPVTTNVYANHVKLHLENAFQLPKKYEETLRQSNVDFQPGGESYAWKYLNSFAQERGKSYHWQISKPTESRRSCSRLSPYLAWGNLSIKQVLHFTKSHVNYSFHKRAFDGMMTRLKWHDHFIQKFEVECKYETHCVNQGYELLDRPINAEFIKAWEEGLTGFPLVDACMRCLKKTGWINFRMRAMVVSMLCHHFDQDWRTGVYHLARLFLDYEPGIHYPQFQMQAGTTGTNTVLIYNPIKQSQDHDPNGYFIKKWVPELKNVPKEFIHEPWRMTPMIEASYKVHIGIDYPKPIVDCKEAAKIARDKIWGHRKNLLVKEEKKRILATHVRPNRKQINIKSKSLK